MGTLFDQAPRKRFYFDYKEVLLMTELIKGVMKESGFEFDQVMRVYEYMQKDRELNISIDGGDTRDEQLAGFGQMLREYLDSKME